MSEFFEITVPIELEPLIPRFLSNRRSEVVRMQALMAQADFNALHMAGHSLKGLGGGYGFHALTEFGDRIEALALARDVQALDKTLGEYADYLAQVRVKYG